MLDRCDPGVLHAVFGEVAQEERGFDFERDGDVFANELVD